MYPCHFSLSLSLTSSRSLSRALSVSHSHMFTLFLGLSLAPLVKGPASRTKLASRSTSSQNVKEIRD